MKRKSDQVAPNNFVVKRKYYHKQDISKLDDAIEQAEKQLNELKYIKFYHETIRNQRVSNFIKMLRKKAPDPNSISSYHPSFHIDQDKLDELLKDYEIYDVFHHESQNRSTMYKYLDHMEIVYKHQDKLHVWQAISKYRCYTLKTGRYHKKWCKIEGDYPPVVKEIFDHGTFPFKEFTGDFYKFPDLNT